MDKLNQMFELQEQLCDRITEEHHLTDHLGRIIKIKTIQDQAQNLQLGVNDLPCFWVKRFLECIKLEIIEAEELLPFKYWSKDKIAEKAFPKLNDSQRLIMLQIELVDILHFLIDAMLASGLSADDLYDLYMKKNQVNFNRQDQGYSTVNKTEEDNIALTKKEGE